MKLTAYITIFFCVLCPSTEYDPVYCVLCACAYLCCAINRVYFCLEFGQSES